ncbi:MAG: glutamate formimidoyltransferase [Deltaproteobacteria bacterium]|nr:glutamate formimidoyltransferase [Deltaproteobacteria bacterium]MBN2845043.1 glutamate formimidoyltransferase [Deltaproteobacteria bacterium]
MKIIECIPNFSEGKDGDKIQNIVDAVSKIEGVKVLDFTMDPDHDRSVITFIGSPEDVLRGAEAACEKALELIDMRTQCGVHPCIGAVDVVPFVPLKGATMADAVGIAHRFGHAFGEKHYLPIFFYGEASLNPERKILSAIRRGQYEGLEEKLKDPSWRPDAGPAHFNPKCGATSVGARKPLIAFNINLDSNNLAVAREIAKEIRESSGGLKNVQAIGIPLESRKIVQVSMNLTDYEVTSVKTVFDAARRKAKVSGIDVLESELIGLIPRRAMEDTTAEYLKLVGFGPEKILENHF